MLTTSKSVCDAILGTGTVAVLSAALGAPPANLYLVDDGQVDTTRCGYSAARRARNFSKRSDDTIPFEQPESMIASWTAMSVCRLLPMASVDVVAAATREPASKRNAMSHSASKTMASPAAGKPKRASSADPSSQEGHLGPLRSQPAVF